MVARMGELTLPPPGGDVIGRRRVDTHILAIRALGAQADFDRVNRAFVFSAKKLSGADILLDEASVTATENIVMAAVLYDFATNAEFRDAVRTEFTRVQSLFGEYQRALEKAYPKPEVKEGG